MIINLRTIWKLLQQSRSIHKLYTGIRYSKMLRGSSYTKNENPFFPPENPIYILYIIYIVLPVLLYTILYIFEIGS